MTKHQNRIGAQLKVSNHLAIFHLLMVLIKIHKCQVQQKEFQISNTIFYLIE